MKILKLERRFQFISSLILIIASCAILAGTPWIQTLTLQLTRTLEPDGIMYRAWQKYPPLIHRFYLFNWTNPDDLYNPDVKPQFTEIGPFIFQFKAEKVNITWNDNNTITFRNLRYWYFDEKRSAYNLSQKITTINALVYFAAYRMRYWSFLLQKAADITLRTLSTEMYLEKTVGELLFEGYDDPVLNIANFATLLPLLQIPGYDKVGWFYQRNGSQVLEEYLNMQTSGEGIGQIRQWNFLSETPYYSNTCNKVTGSTCEFFPAPLTKKPLEIFWPEACRSFAFEFEEETTHGNFRAFKYSGKNTFDNGTKFPGNRCYWTGGDAPSGTFNFSTCRYGTPVFASLPHFYGADPYYAKRVGGLRPNKEKHDVLFILEPNTGTPLYGKARVQANVLLQPNEHLSMFKHVPKVYMPIIWVEQEAELPANYQFLLKLYLNQGIILRTTAMLGVFIGALMFIASVWKQKLTASHDKCETVNRHVITDMEVSKNKETKRLLTM